MLTKEILPIGSIVYLKESYDYKSYDYNSRR